MAELSTVAVEEDTKLAVVVAVVATYFADTGTMLDVMVVVV